MKKIISLILLTVLLLAALVSCTYNDDPFRDDYGFDTNALTNKATQTDIYPGQIYSAVPSKLDFEGLELNILAREKASVSREWDKKEEKKGDYGSAIQSRNKQISDELNLTFKLSTIPYHGEWTEFYKDLKANDDYADIYSISADQASALEIRGLQANMLDKQVFPYFDFSMPCWNQSIADLQIPYGKLYYIAGALNLSLYDQTVIMWHNKTLYDKVKTPDDPADMQALAIDGSFTYDQLYKWSTLIIDEGTGKMCDNKYGISDLETNFYDAIPYAWELKLITTNTDNTHSLNVSNNILAENALRDLRLLREQQGVNNCQPTLQEQSCSVGIVNHFANGQSMFMPNTLRLSEDDNRIVREMDDQFVILPLPKYSLAQKDYATTAVGDFELVSVIDHGDDIKGEAVSAFLQKINELSYSDAGFYFRELLTPMFLGQIDWSDPYMQPTIKGIELFQSLTKVTVFDEVKLYQRVLSDLTWSMGGRVESHNDGLYSQFTTTPPMYSSIWTANEWLEYWENRITSLDNYLIGRPIPEDVVID